MSQRTVHTTPGVRLDLLSLLLCQHHDLVANAQERGIPVPPARSKAAPTAKQWLTSRSA